MEQRTGSGGMRTIIHDLCYHTSTLPVKINLRRIWKWLAGQELEVEGEL